MPARVRGDACCRERLGPPPVVLDAHDPPVAQSEDVEDLPLERLAPYLRDAQATGSHDHLLIAAGELERVDLAALLETPAEGVDHLLATVADPVLAQPLPGDVGTEYPRCGVEVAAPERAEEVDHHRLEVLLADARHCLLLVRTDRRRKRKSRARRCPRASTQTLGCKCSPRRQRRARREEFRGPLHSAGHGPHSTTGALV